MNDKKNITGIILAGGKSSRMGTDKGLVLFNKKPFVHHIIKAMTPLVDSILIVSNNMAYDTFGHTRVEDLVKNSGPVAGLYTGLSYSKTSDNLVLSCDVPFITTHLLRQLLSHKEEGYDIIQFSASRKTIPLVAIYQKHCATMCEKLLQQRELRLRKLVSSAKTKTIALQEEEYNIVANINTMKDFKTIIYATHD